MSMEKEGNEPIQEVAEVKQETEKEKPKQDVKPKRELTPQEIQRRKKMLVYPLFFLIFIGAMWLIFAPSKSKDKQLPDGFNSDLPVPKDEAIIADKRAAYEQESQRGKEEEKRRSLQDFAFMLSEEENSRENTTADSPEFTDAYANRESSLNTIQSSSYAYQDVNRQLEHWYDREATEMDEQAQLELQWRIQELERKLEAVENSKSSTDEQLELIERSYAIASRYMPGHDGQVADSDNSVQSSARISSMREKVVAEPVSQVRSNMVSLLAAPLDNDEFMEQYGKPRNMGFITAAGGETFAAKNAIRASVYQTVTLSDGKNLQLRLLEPIQAGSFLIPANTVLTGSAKIGAERLLIAISSIQYDNNVIPVELKVYDMDGIEGISVPSSAELNAVKEIAANMGTQMGSSITITSDAGSQLAADLGRSTIQGASQYISRKMREVKVTLKANYNVLLLPQ